MGAPSPWITLGITLLVLTILVVVYVLRNRIWGVSADSNQEQLLAAGFGYYDSPVTSDCITEQTPTLCTEVGLQTTTAVCIPHPVTGRGCLDAENNQTFATRVTTTRCTSTCRSSVWETTMGTCVSPALPAAGCYSRNTLGSQSRTQICRANDATGPNTCTFQYAKDSGLPLPPGCTLNSLGSLATCQVGTSITITEPCAPDLSPLCGRWVVPEDDNAPCQYSSSSIEASVCYGENAVEYRDDEAILNLGWSTLPMKCVRDDDPTVPAAICPSILNCVLPETAYARLLASGGEPIVVCPSRTSPPGCVRSCIYYPPAVKESWIPELQKLLLSFHLLRVTPPSGEKYVLGLNNVPCPGPGGRYLVDGLTANTTVLGDCYGDPLAPLADTPLLMINTSRIVANTTGYGLSRSCTSTEAIEQATGLYLAFRPTRPASLGQGQVLYCTILAVLGKNYYGYLAYQNGELLWTPTAVGGFTNESQTGLRPMEFVVEVDSTNPGGYSVLSSATIPTTVSSQPTLNLNSVTFEQSITDLKSLHTVLNNRQTRWNPQSCNAMYTYPPVVGYPQIDTATVEMG